MFRVRSRVSQFRMDARGSIAPLAGMLTVLIVVFSGMAIDLGRWAHSRQVTLAALDSAVLSGARWLTINPGDADGAVAVARKHYEENVRSRFNLESDTVDFAVEDNDKSIVATGQATLKTTIMGIAGIAFVPLLDESAAGLPKATVGSGGSNIEISVMLDVTGSMCDDGAGPCTTGVKLDGLKVAAKKLVDIVVSSDQSVVYSKLAIVPFARRIRVGPNGGGASIMKTLTNLDATWSGWNDECISWSGESGSETGGSWACTQSEAQYFLNYKIIPCLTERYYINGAYFDFTDDAPGPGIWLNAHNGARSPYFEDSSDMHPIADPVGSSASPVNQFNYDYAGYCREMDEANEVMPLSSDIAGLKARIDGLVGFSSTAGPMGTAWSWYMLSPNWGGAVWSGESVPGSYADLTAVGVNGASRLRKVAILMTDGVYNTYRSTKGSDKVQMSTAAKAYCTAMKAKGIEIFTVGLALDELSSSDRALAEDVLLNCGTDISHFYNTFSVNELVSAFETIGATLTTVTLTR